MGRAWVLSLGGVAIVAAGISGCSNTRSAEESAVEVSTSAVSTSAVSTSVVATATPTSGPGVSAGPGTARITIDDTPQEVRGQVVCTTMGGNLNIAIGEQGTGVAVVMAEDASSVSSVGLGNVNGVVMGYQQNVPGGSASATRDGKTYTVSGTASGVDMANPMQPVTKPFEIEVSCP